MNSSFMESIKNLSTWINTGKRERIIMLISRRSCQDIINFMNLIEENNECLTPEERNKLFKSFIGNKKFIAYKWLNEVKSTEEERIIVWQTLNGYNFYLFTGLMEYKRDFYDCSILEQNVIEETILQHDNIVCSIFLNNFPFLKLYLKNNREKLLERLIHKGKTPYINSLLKRHGCLTTQEIIRIIDWIINERQYTLAKTIYNISDLSCIVKDKNKLEELLVTSKLCGNFKKLDDLNYILL